MSNYISKTQFMKLLSCPRYAALRELEWRENRRTVITLEDAIVYEEVEKIEKIRAAIMKMRTDDGDSLLDIPNEHLNMLLPHFSKLEEYAGISTEEFFGGDVQYSRNISDQKQFTAVINEQIYLCFVDIFQKDNETFNVIESKGTTSRKFANLSYKEDGWEYFIFYRDVYDGVFKLREFNNGELLNSKKYMKQRSKLFNRKSDVGHYVYDLAFQRYVIENSGKFTDKELKEAGYYLAVFDHEYIHDGGELDPTEIVAFIDLTDITKEYMPIIEKDFATVNSYLSKNALDDFELGRHCKINHFRECRYFKTNCGSILPKENNILRYMRSTTSKYGVDKTKTIFDVLSEGYVNLKDMPENWLHINNHKIQREHTINGNLYLDINKIEDGLNQLKYPIYHLDFETFPGPIPRFSGESPYSQSLFQVSIHVEREPGVCDKDKDHYEYLSLDHQDHREEIAKLMLSVIKDDGGSVLVHNRAFEKTRIRELSELFPKYGLALDNISGRLFDLLHITKTNTDMYTGLGYHKDRAKQINLYHKDLNGSFSLKNLARILTPLDYNDLEISSGVYSMVLYSRLNQFETFEELRKAYRALREYCKQDTWVMVLILRTLRELIK